MKTLLRAAAAIAALSLAAPALAQQATRTDPRFGLGAGITSATTSGYGNVDVGTLLYVPMNLTPNFRLEPFIGWARADLDNVPAVLGAGAGQQFPPYLEGKSSDFTLGVGGFLVKPVAPQVQVYLGGRLASQWQSMQDNAGNKASRRNTLLAVAAGGEYLPVPRVAFGAELQLAYISYGDTEWSGGGGSVTGGGGSGSGTQATLFARFYLF